MECITCKSHMHEFCINTHHLESDIDRGKSTTWEEQKIQLQQGKNTAKKKGEDGASVSNAVVMQSMQQMQHQMQQQGQQIESKIGGTTEKIDIVQENQLILQTHIDEMHQQFEGKVNVLEEKVDNAIGQLDARINTQEKDADAVKNEIKALKKELAKQQTNDVTTSSIKVKTPLFDGTTNFNAFKLQFGVVATKNIWDDDHKAVALRTSLRGAAAEIIHINPEGKKTEFAAIMDALERKYDSKHVKEVSHLELSLRCQKLNERIQDYATEIERLANLAYIGAPDNVLKRLKIGAFVKGLRDAELKTAVWTSPKTTFTETLGFALTQEAASVLWTSSMEERRTEVNSENDISDVVCAVLRQILRENKRMPLSKTRKCYACQKPGHFARECRSKHKGSHSTSPTRNISEGASEISNKLKRISTAGQRLTPKFRSHRSKKNSTREWFRTATGDEAVTGGKIMRTISVSDVSMKHEFLVTDIMDEVILGMGFMAKHGLVLDMKRQMLQYATVTLPLTVQAEVLQVAVQRQQKIPSKSEAIVWARATQEIRLSKIWVVEPSEECTKDNIIIGKAVVLRVNNLIPARVLNPTSDTTKVQKRNIIAQCQKAECVVNHQIKIPKTYSKISPEAEIFIQRWTSNQNEQRKRYAKNFLLENWSIFAGVTSSGDRTYIEKHVINTAGADPIRQRQKAS
uniref:CCHC-type domain-containing protein n=1 Tax=Glossina austeni TaxID=7395 RepID=A0A1A9VE53_GLOAU